MANKSNESNIYNTEAFQKLKKSFRALSALDKQDFLIDVQWWIESGTPPRLAGKAQQVWLQMKSILDEREKKREQQKRRKVYFIYPQEGLRFPLNKIEIS